MEEGLELLRGLGQGFLELQPTWVFLFREENLLFMHQILGAVIEMLHQPWGPQTLAKLISLAGSQQISRRASQTSGYSPVLGELGLRVLHTVGTFSGSMAESLASVGA